MSRLERISFDHFVFESRNYLAENPYLIKHLNPYNCSFFKCGDTYLALSISGNILEVGMVLGKGSDFIHSIPAECNKGGLKFIKFITSEKNIRVHKIAQYCQALKIDVIKDFYAPGENGWQYMINLEDSSRFSRL